MTYKSQAFALAFKHRELENGPEVYWAFDALQQTIIRLYRQQGSSSAALSGGRSLAARVLAATGDGDGDGSRDHPRSPTPVSLSVDIRR